MTAAVSSGHFPREVEYTFSSSEASSPARSGGAQIQRHHVTIPLLPTRRRATARRRRQEGTDSHVASTQPPPPAPQRCAGYSVPVEISILVLEDCEVSDFALFTWPSSVSLASFLYSRPGLCRGKTVLELGAGTCLSGLMAARLGASAVTLTDRPTPEVLRNMEAIASRNRGAAPFMASSERNETVADGLRAATSACEVRVVGLEWGVLSSANVALLQQDFDLVLGADVFYSSEHFDAVLATVVAALRRWKGAGTCATGLDGGGGAGAGQPRFITAYHERSVRRSIRPLLHKWGLKARVLQEAEHGETLSSISIVEMTLVPDPHAPRDDDGGSQ